MPQTIDKPVPLSSAEYAETELISTSDSRSSLISIDPKRMWGTPCFAGTRLPVKSLFDHLERGLSLEEFVNNFEGISRETCVQTLQMAFERLMEGLPNGKAAR